MLAALESMRTKRLNELVTLVQKNVRRRLEYKKYQDLRKKTIRIQSWWRGVLAQRYAEQLRKETAATKIQKMARGWMARKRYTEVRQAVVKIQSGESGVRIKADRCSRSRTSSQEAGFGGTNQSCCSHTAESVPRIVSLAIC